jgi:hypothetical protein
MQYRRSALHVKEKTPVVLQDRRGHVEISGQQRFDNPFGSL